MQILELTGCTLAVSLYLQNRIVLVSAEDGRIAIQAAPFQRPMGIATKASGSDRRLAVATFHEVVLLGDSPLLAGALGTQIPHEHLLVPRGVLFSGDIDGHDLCWVNDELLVANTRFSCIARLGTDFSFTPVWTPPFITHLAPEDRCHLNGLAPAGDGIAFATAFGRSDAARGWSETRASGGILMEVPSGETILEGLSMPHSPRVFAGRPYVLESGYGRVLEVDAPGRSARTLAELPGFTRGLDRLGDILFVGMSRMRDRTSVRLPVADKHGRLLCGVAAIDRRDGRVLGWVKFDDSYEEVFDVKVLPDFRRGAMLSVDDPRHHRGLVFPGRAFWVEDPDPADD